MITFKSPEDLSKLSPDDPAFETVRELIFQLITAYSPPGRAYDPVDDGYVILLNSEAEVNGTPDEHWDGCTLLSIPRSTSIFATNHIRWAYDAPTCLSAGKA